MHTLYDLPAPAKINLFLHLTGRRADGYHLLESVCMLLDWCDTLHVELRASGAIARTDLGGGAPLPALDLCLRAALALRAATGCRLGAQIALHKKIPLQAGLGGGSSDAATTLLALNRLWRLRLPRAALEHIGNGLGADVAFFLRGSNALVRGAGECITPLSGAQRLPAAHFAVVKPAAGLATAAVFSAAQLPCAVAAATIAGFAATPFDFGRNDLQPAAQVLCPAVAQAIEWLAQRGLQGRMTGSGSAVFAHLPDSVQALSGALPADWQLRVCANLPLHPLAGWAAGEE